jgi:hypothetical protein
MLHRILLHASLLFLSICAVFLIIKSAGLADFNAGSIWYLASLGISLASALAISFKSKSRLLNILVDIDQRLDLQDRVSTAYEYLNEKKNNEFRELLLTDATVRLRQFKMQQIVPAHFSPLHLLAILLLIGNITLSSGILFTSDNGPDRQDLQKVENAGRLLDQFLTATKNRRADRQSKPESDYLKKLEQFSKKFSDNSKSINQRSAALTRFLQEVQGEQTRLAGELGTQLDSAGIKNLPVQKKPDLADLSANQLKKLKEVLDRALNSLIPYAISRNIESLQELDGIEKLLSRIIDYLDDNPTDSEEISDSAPNERRTSRSAGTRENLPDDRNESDSDDLLSDYEKSPEDRIRKPHEGSDAGGDDSHRDGEEKSDGYSSSPGSAASKEELKESNELEASSGTPMQEKPAASPAKNYLIHIRAMTDLGEARLNEEEIFQSYRGEVESILHKEDMPANYREYIKNYFISIGLNTEE